MKHQGTVLSGLGGFLAALVFVVHHVYPEAPPPPVDATLAVHVMTAENHPFVGTVWRVEGGLFVTALHVPTDETEILVDGRPAQLLAIDRGADLCVLRVPGLGGPCLPLGEPRVGTEAHVEGFVGVGAYGYHMTTWGRITSLSLPDGFTGYDGGMQPGLSGSPVLDAHGRVLGVVSSVQSWSSIGPNSCMGRLCPLDALRVLLSHVDVNGPALRVPKSKEDLCL